MRIDLPCCGFKNCRYCFDGNCMKPSKQEKCEYWYVLHKKLEVIRCKDCKHFESGYELCNACGDGCNTDPDGWCFMGERIGEEE